MAITYGGYTWTPRQNTTNQPTQQQQQGGGSSGGSFPWGSLLTPAVMAGLRRLYGYYNTPTGTESGAGGAPIAEAVPYQGIDYGSYGGMTGDYATDFGVPATQAGTGAGVEAGSGVGSQAAWDAYAGGWGGGASAGAGAGAGSATAPALGEAGYMGAAGAGEGAAAGAGAAAAGAGAGTIAGGIAAPIIAWYLNRSAGSRVNEPVQRTQEIYQGANSLINLLRQGNNPSGYGRLVRDPQVMDYPALTYQSYQNNPIDIGELYNYMHNIGAGGSPGGGNPSWLTDTDIDSLLYQNGISPEQLSQVLGYTPNYNNRNWDSSPDLSVRTQPDTDRNIRMQEQRLTPEDAALMGITPDDPRYYILLDPYYTGRNR